MNEARRHQFKSGHYASPQARKRINHSIVGEQEFDDLVADVAGVMKTERWRVEVALRWALGRRKTEE